MSLEKVIHVWLSCHDEMWLMLFIQSFNTADLIFGPQKGWTFDLRMFTTNIVMMLFCLWLRPVSSLLIV